MTREDMYPLLKDKQIRAIKRSIEELEGKRISYLNATFNAERENT